MVEDGGWQDVVGDDLQTIASGPTAPDGCDWGACVRVIEKCVQCIAERIGVV